MSADRATPLRRTPLMRPLPHPLTLVAALACARPGKLPAGDSPSDSPASEIPAADPTILRGARALVLDPALGLEEGAAVDLQIEGGRLTAIAASGALTGAEVVDLSGAWIVPAFIDSHVHLAYRPDAEGMADGGVAGAVDMAAPIAFLSADHAPLVVKAAGPMVTATGGYPTQSWGRDGYGLECADAEEAVAAVERLADLGADLIKMPLTGSPELDDDAQAAVVAAAHARGLKVASHALDPISVGNAATAGVDLLAHTPTAELSAELSAAWSGKAVVSTLRAFGGSARAVANLAALSAAGATVLYGTDFGNTSTAGVDGSELTLLEAAGLSGEAILRAGTSEPAFYWGFSDLGQLAVGRRASLMVLDADPRAEPGALATPSAVYIDGSRR